MKKIMLGLAVLFGSMAFGVTANASSNQRIVHRNPKTTQPVKQAKFYDGNFDTYLRDLSDIRLYQKTAIYGNDHYLFNLGNRVWSKVVKDYYLNPYSLKFDNPAQTYLVTQRSRFQRDYLIGTGQIK